MARVQLRYLVPCTRFPSDHAGFCQESLVAFFFGRSLSFSVVETVHQRIAPLRTSVCGCSGFLSYERRLAAQFELASWENPHPLNLAADRRLPFYKKCDQGRRFNILTLPSKPGESAIFTKTIHPFPLPVGSFTTCAHLPSKSSR